MTSPGRRRREKVSVRESGRETSAIAAVIQQILAKSSRKVAGGTQGSPLTEVEALKLFCQEFQGERSFSRHPKHRSFTELLQVLKRHRITTSWLEGVGQRGVVSSSPNSGDHVHSVLTCLRLLLRDEKYQHMFMEDGITFPVLTKCLLSYTSSYFSDGSEDSTVSSTLTELTNIFQKLSNSGSYGELLVEHGVHLALVQLLSASDLVPLQCSLCALINLSKSASTREAVGELNCVPTLLHILQFYNTSSRQLASDLLLLLSQSPTVRTQVKENDGLPLCLRLLHSEDMHVLHRMVGVLEGLAEDSEVQEEIRLLGGLPLLLALLSKQTSGCGPESDSETAHQRLLALKTACCAAITQLVLSDSNAQHIVQGNGVYLLSSLTLPQGVRACADQRLQESLQKNALRALRYLFSMERNRQIFKRLFPPRLFATFIDIGHYARDLSAYSPLVEMINTLPESEVAVIQANIEATDQNKAPIFTVGGYAVLDLLGSGAFGSVYKVRKKTSDVLLAMKVIKATHPGLGKTVTERSSGLGKILNEVEIMREQLRHPNIVRYHKCFQEGGHLYIIMELLEGAPLSEYITSLREKGQRFTEDRLWKIFTQLVLALRYIHKEKKIVHRDLSPANIMLGDGDKLTITDFGLAKQKQREFSVMKSVVGTMLYWCPELVQSEPYNEKADIWAAGCILYQMATLQPPFYTSNLLALAKKIAEVDYEPLPAGRYSPLVNQVVCRCLTADPERRPDSVELGSLISMAMMQYVDRLALQNEGLERRLSKEKQRTIKHFHKAVWSEQRYQQLLSASEREDSMFPSVRRKLSTSFSMISERDESPQRPRSRTVESDSTDMAAEDNQEMDESDLTDENTSDREALHGSSDSVFARDNHTDTIQTLPLFPGQQAPPLDTTPPLRPKENPLTSRVNRGRSHSAVTAGNRGRGVEQFTSTPPGRQLTSVQTRSQSAAYLGGRKASLGLSGGPLSPLGRKGRTPSVSSLLSFSPHHVREISDPITQLMSQLHKLVFVAQLPPSLKPCARRQLVRQYKRALFDGSSSPANLKSEMHKLMSGVGESVELLSVSGDGLQTKMHLAQRALSELAARRSPEEVVSMDEGLHDSQGISYEQLQAILESTLAESGYYETEHT